MNRRGFLKTLSSLVALPLAAKLLPALPKPKEDVVLPTAGNGHYVITLPAAAKPGTTIHWKRVGDSLEMKMSYTQQGWKA